MLDPMGANNQREPFNQALSVHRESGQAQGIAKLEIRIAKNLERQVQARGHLLLIFGGLCAQTEHGRLQIHQFTVMITKGTSLRRATSRPGDGVPAVRQRLARHAGHWIAVKDRCGRGEFGEMNHPVRRGAKGDVRHGQAAQMAGGSVVQGLGQAGWQREIGSCLHKL